VLPRERFGAVHLGACAVDQHPAKQIVERLGRPWNLLACGVAHDDTVPILQEHLARLGVEQDECGNAADLELLRELLREGSASQGISLWYAANCSSSLSFEMKTISKGLAAAIVLQAAARFGVKLRHGGHQCAEK